METAPLTVCSSDPDAKDTFRFVVIVRLLDEAKDVVPLKVTAPALPLPVSVTVKLSLKVLVVPLLANVTLLPAVAAAFVMAKVPKVERAVELAVRTDPEVVTPLPCVPLHDPLASVNV